MNIAALVSGGVDSSVVVHLLKEQGFTPDIFYIRIGMEDEEGYIDCPAEEDIEITQWIARHYGCRFEEVNLHKEYWDNVVSYTIETVRRGLTPNPSSVPSRTGAARITTASPPATMPALPTLTVRCSCQPPSIPSKTRPTSSRSWNTDRYAS